MNIYDYLVLFASILGIAIYGIVRTRGRRNLHDYLRGKKQPWFLIGLSVMATQASAVTFLSTPGQGYASGMAFVQNYFAVPLAMVIIAAFFLPIYRRLNVYTAYEYLGKRFDTKTRLLAASIFLIARGFGAGITIYAPAIVLSTVFGWSLPLTIIGAGLVVIGYTVAGGSDAVTHTQKYQVAIIFAGMVAAFIILLHKIPCSFTDALTLAGHFNKTTAVDFSLDPKKEYTVWTGMFGGIFLMLSYFGTDQSQVQRYISGDQLRESRLGLMFNALLKIPMQFGILLLGIMLFVFYQFHPSPIFFNKPAWEANRDLFKNTTIFYEAAPLDSRVMHLEEGLAFYQHLRQQSLEKWINSRQENNPGDEADAMHGIISASNSEAELRSYVKQRLKDNSPSFNTKDSDYVFITFILDNIPHGLIGLLVAAFFAAALSSKAGELNALASTTTVDFYRPYFRKTKNIHSTLGTQDSELTQDDRHYVLASKTFTAFWGLVAIAFALFAHMSRNLIEASNIVGSIFSGVILGLFLLAFFIKYVKGTAAFTAALVAQTLVIAVFAYARYKGIPLPYLWLNAIGALTCILLALILQPFLPPRDTPGFPITPEYPSEPEKKS